MPTISRQLRQAYDLQDLAYSMAMALKADCLDASGKVIVRRDEDGKPIDAQAIAQIMKAWQGAQERISFHRRIPSPGSLRPVAEGKRKVSRPIPLKLTQVQVMPAEAQATPQ